MEKWLLMLLLPAGLLFGKDYKGAEYRTKTAYIYGRFEVNYKSSRGAGQTSTFFTYHELGSGGLSEWNELDIEILGRYENDVQFNAITPGQTNHEHHQWVGFDPSADFHTYAIEWTPDYVAWFADGEELYRQTEDHVATLTRAQKIMMNIWPPAYSDWVGDLDVRMLPFRAYYDWVSYASYTPNSGNCGTDNNFTLQWRDDFDSWDTGRWEKATHTWNGNNSDFIQDNCVFQDGKMVLCLTDDVNTGFTDRRSPFIRWARYMTDTVIVSFSEEITVATAQNLVNYRITGVTLENALLQSDARTVNLAVSGMDATGTYTLVALGIKDNTPEQNTLIGQSIAIQMPPQWGYPLQINVGGDAWNSWLADQEWTFNSDFGHIGGGNGSFPGKPINGTVDDIIYQSEQWGIVGYHVRLPEGKYTIRLHFAENYFTAADQRIFDINIEGKYTVRNLDVFNEAGASGAYIICAENISVEDGVLDIHFGNIADNCFLNGISIEQIPSRNRGELKILKNFRLQQNYPNPFNARTIIRYDLPETAQISLTVHDLKGAIIEELINGQYNAGSYRVQWAAPVPSGIYIYKMQSVSENCRVTDVKKMIVLK